MDTGLRNRAAAVAGISLLVAGSALHSTREALRCFWRAELGVCAALLVGLAQALALVPGVSRSRATLTAALWLDVAPLEAAAFPFLMSVAAIAGAGALEFAVPGTEPAGPCRRGGVRGIRSRGGYPGGPLRHQPSRARALSDVLLTLGPGTAFLANALRAEGLEGDVVTHVGQMGWSSGPGRCRWRRAPRIRRFCRSSPLPLEPFAPDHRTCLHTQKRGARPFGRAPSWLEEVRKECLALVDGHILCFVFRHD